MNPTRTEVRQELESIRQLFKETGEWKQAKIRSCWSALYGISMHDEETVDDQLTEVVPVKYKEESYRVQKSRQSFASS